VIYIFTTSQFYPMQFLLFKVGNDLTIGREESSTIPKSQFSEIQIRKIDDELRMVRK
jgi:hypothetical protein